jgi:hypothetical protein
MRLFRHWRACPYLRSRAGVEQPLTGAGVPYRITGDQDDMNQIDPMRAITTGCSEETF